MIVGQFETRSISDRMGKLQPRFSINIVLMEVFPSGLSYHQETMKSYYLVNTRYGAELNISWSATNLK